MTFYYRFLSFVVFILTSLLLHAQSPIDKKITIHIQDKTVEEVFQEIHNKTGLEFSYSNDQLDAYQRLTFKFKNKPVQEVISCMANKMGVDYVFVEQQVVLKKLKQNTPISPVVKSKNKYVLSGHVKDKETGEVLIGATVHVLGTTMGVFTNAYGFYSITLDEGDYSIAFSSIGFAREQVSVSLSQNKYLAMTMDLDKALLQEIEIVASEQEEVKQVKVLSNMNIQSKTVQQVPGMMGEAELLKMMKSLPGVKSFGDGSAVIYVRGGGREQNMIYIDEAPVYNPSHI